MKKNLDDSEERRIIIVTIPNQLKKTFCSKWRPIWVHFNFNWKTNQQYFSEKKFFFFSFFNQQKLTWRTMLCTQQHLKLLAQEEYHLNVEVQLQKRIEKQETETEKVSWWSPSVNRKRQRKRKREKETCFLVHTISILIWNKTVSFPFFSLFVSFFLVERREKNGSKQERKINQRVWREWSTPTNSYSHERTTFSKREKGKRKNLSWILDWFLFFFFFFLSPSPSSFGVKNCFQKEVKFMLGFEKILKFPKMKVKPLGKNSFHRGIWSRWTLTLSRIVRFPSFCFFLSLEQILIISSSSLFWKH